MEIKFEKVFERDIDLLIINKFINEPKIIKCFLDKLNLNNYRVMKVEHSLMDNDGESDITIILQNDYERIALLIEDKIDAIAMPNQRDRYDIRGNKGLEKKEYDRYFVFIIAPQDYLNTNLESKKYENRISYEELQAVLKEDIYAFNLLAQAIEEKKKGYVIIENKDVTKFWDYYYKHIKTNYPRLDINEVSGPRGSRASWPQIKTPIKNVYIIHKSDRGYLDLTFSGQGNNYNNFMLIVKELLDKDMSVHKTGKSMAIRVIVPIIDFKNNFEDYSQDIDKIFNNAIRLLDLLEKIDINKMYMLDVL